MSKSIQKLKEDIIKALEEPKKLDLMDLGKSVYALAIASAGLGVAVKSLKENKLMEDKTKKCRYVQSVKKK